MNLQKHKRVIISGGGTGGHIFPAISIANALRKIDPETEILFVGAEGRMEMEKIPAAGYKIIGLPVAGLYRSLTFKNFTVLIKLLKSLNKAKKVIKEFRSRCCCGCRRLCKRAGSQTGRKNGNSYTHTGTEQLCRSDK